MIYNNAKRYDDARAVLDAIETTYMDYWVCTTEMAYWDGLKNIEQVKLWYKKANQLAENDEQRLGALNSIAGAFLMMEIYGPALEGYKRVLKLDPNDPWAWHNASVIYMRTKDYDQAEIYNQKALKLMEFGAARNVQKTLVKKRLAEKQQATGSLWTQILRMLGLKN